MELEQLVSECLKPLEGPEGPAGVNARHEPLYDQVRTEVNKLTAQAIGEEGVDWKGLVDACTQLLTTKTKDLALAAYLGLGLLRTHGYEGLAAGLEVLTGLVKQMWDQAWPPAKRARARANIFEWADQRLSEAVEAITPGADELGGLKKAAEQAQELADTIQEKMGVGQVTGLSTLRGALGKWLEELAPPEEEQPAEAQPPQELEAPPPSGPAIPEKLESLDQGLELMGQLVGLIRAVAPASPVPYRLARMLRWDILEELPEADASGQTQVPAPRPEELEPLAAMEKAGQWAELVEAAESRFLAPGGTFILGLQRMVHQGLKAMGAQAAAEAVEWEVRRLLARLPEISRLKFDDGSGFADRATAGWLQGLNAAEQPQQDSSPPPVPQQLGELLERGKLAEAMAEADKALAAAPGLREQVLIRLEVAEACLAQGKPEWAAAILEGLEEEIGSAGIEKWDPKVCARVLAGLISALEGAWEGREWGPSEYNRLQQLRKRLFRLDMARAVGAG